MSPRPPSTTLLASLLAPCLAGWLSLATPLRAEPVSLEQLLGLARDGVGAKALLALVETQGVAAPVAAAQVSLMHEAGFSEGLMEAVIRAGAPALPAGQEAAGAAGATTKEAPATDGGADEAPGKGGVTYGERDGFLVVKARGPRDTGSPEREPKEAPASVPQLPPAQVIVLNQVPAAPVPAAPAAAAERSGPTAAPENRNPYPVGAVTGPGGSTLFLPARFGEPASSFGRTVVFDLDLHRPGAWHDAWHPHRGPGDYHGHVTGAAEDGEIVTGPAGSYRRPGSGWRTIRTSRGLIRVPK